MKPSSAMQNKPKIGAANIDIGKLKGPAEEAVTSAEEISATGTQVIPQAMRMPRSMLHCLCRHTQARAKAPAIAIY